jgi:hypothetical protein
MKRDSLDTRVDRAPFFAKVLHECWACHARGIKPGVLDTHLGDYGVRQTVSREYQVLALSERGLCPGCEASPPPEVASD